MLVPNASELERKTELSYSPDGIFFLWESSETNRLATKIQKDMLAVHASTEYERRRTGNLV